MLALTRRVGEEIVIGDPRQPLGIVRVVEVRGDKVRLAFDFPPDVEVTRRELADQKARGPLPASATPAARSASARASAAPAPGDKPAKG